MSSGGPGNIIIRVGAETAAAVAGLNRVQSALGDSMTTGQRATAALHRAALPAAAALGAIGVAAVDATKAALEDAAAQDKLAGQLHRTAGANDAAVAAAEDYISKLSLATGVADDDLRPALGKLATATGDVGKAQDLLSIALDTSVQTGKSLDSVTSALAKGYAGNTAAIGRLVPGMDAAVLKSKDMAQVTDELSRLTGGAAAQAAGTAAGQYAVWQNQMNELKETLGASLIPLMETLLGILSKATEFMANHTTAVKVAIGVIAGLSAAILTANAALKAYEVVQGVATVAQKVYAAMSKTTTAATEGQTAAQWLLNAALSANPIGLVVIALAGLVAAFILAWKNSETFRNIVTGAFNAVKAAASVAWEWIKDHWQVALFAFGPLGVAIGLLAKHFDTVKAAGETAFNVIKAAIDAVAGAIQGVIGAVESLIGWLGRIHVPHINLPGPFLAPAPAVAGARSGGRATTAAAPITVNVYGAIDPEGTARAVNRVLLAHDRRMGRRP